MAYSYQVVLVAFIFAATVVVASRGTPLAYGVSVAAVLIAMTTGLSSARLIAIACHTLRESMTLNLLVAVILIRWLGDLMNSSGSLSRSCDLLQQLVGDVRVVAMVIPMLVGLLMVPGGAILSAPSVERLTNDLDLQPSKQASINLVFRHIGQICFPMSASLLMLTSIVGVNLARQVLYQLPIAISIGLLAFRFYFSSVRHDIEKDVNREGKLLLLRALIVELRPILVILILFTLTHQIAWALTLGTVCALYQYRLSMKEILSSFQLRISFESMLLIIGILTIRSLLQNEVITEAFAILISRSPMGSLIISLLPWIIGFFTGSVLAAVSLATPLLLPLINTDIGAYFFCASVFMGAFSGYMVSPIHLCLSLTAEYYEVSLGEVYRDIWVPTNISLAQAVALGILSTIL